MRWGRRSRRCHRSQRKDDDHVPHLVPVLSVSLSACGRCAVAQLPVLRKGMPARKRDRGDVARSSVRAVRRQHRATVRQSVRVLGMSAARRRQQVAHRVLLYRGAHFPRQQRQLRAVRRRHVPDRCSEHAQL